jgi:hypothetical protein
MVMAGVDRNPIEPSGELRATRVLATLSVDRQEGVLCGIERVFAAAHHPEAEPEDMVLVACHQLIERGAISTKEV